MRTYNSLSDTENIIMNFIWDKESPVTTREIMDNLAEAKDWKHNTTVTFLSRLVKKGFLSATRIGKAHHYTACITRNEYLDLETRHFIRKIHKGSIFGFVASLCNNETLTKEEIDRLIKRLEEE